MLGVDGSGKSTQTHLLAEWLTGEGVPAQYFENPGGRRALNHLAVRLGRADGRALVGPRGVVAVELVIRWLAITRALLVSRATGRVAVMDRYTLCQFAIMRARRDRGERVARAVLRWFPEPDLLVLLAAPAVVAQHRVDERGKDHEELSYLQALAAAYDSLPESGRLRRVDASGSIDEVQAALRELVAPVVGLAG